MEMLVDAAVVTSAWIGGAVVFAAALNGIAVLHSYFRVFTGARRAATTSLAARPAERIAVIGLATLILGGGLIPQPGVVSRYRAAIELVSRRDAADADQFAQNIETPGLLRQSGLAR
jgi:NADH-quinone oxidoreductase subunit M